MGWAIFFLMVAAILFLLPLVQDETNSGQMLGSWGIGVVFMLVGSMTLYFSGTGEIAKPNVLWRAPIYKVVGSVYPYGQDGKQITVLEDGAENIYAVWLAIPDDSRFIRITDDSKAVKVDCETQKDTKPEKMASDPVKKPKGGK